MAAVSDDMIAVRCGGVGQKFGGGRMAVSIGGVRARLGGAETTARLWGAVALSDWNHNWAGRNGVTGVRERSQQGLKLLLRHPSV